MATQTTNTCQEGYIDSINFTNTVTPSTSYLQAGENFTYSISFYVPVYQGNPPTHFIINSIYDKSLNIKSATATITDKDLNEETNPVVIDPEKNMVQVQFNYSTSALKNITIQIKATLDDTTLVTNNVIPNTAELLGSMCGCEVFSIEKDADITINRTTFTKDTSTEVLISTVIEDITKAPETKILSNTAPLKISKASDADPDITNVTNEVLLTAEPPISVTCNQAITDLIESLALEETAIANIIRIESEKIIKIANMESNLEEILQVNSSVEKVLANIALIEEALKNKLSIALTVYKDTTKNNKIV